MSSERRALVAISPSIELARRRSLFAALEHAFPVSFVATEGPVGRNTDGAVTFGEECVSTALAVPRLELGASDGQSPGRIAFTDALAVPGCFRGRSFSDEQSGGIQPVRSGPDDIVLASCNGKPVWSRAGAGALRATLAPDELAENASLRDLLRPGHFMSLLPLVEFVREVTAPLAWTPPPLVACFVIDDPNLHRSRYGYIDYAELAKHAERHDYHTAMAFIPLDAWHASGAACRIFRQHPQRLSLLVHGNDHVHSELGRDLPDANLDALLAQALRRVFRFEQRTGIRIARVMAPPHGAVSVASLRGLDRAGFDAICSTNAYSWINHLAPNDVLGWDAGGFAAGCLGALPRLPLSGGVDDLAFRSYLSQPLILYGHHDDLAQGLEVLADIARHVHGLGAVRWGALDTFVETRAETRVEGSLLRARLLSRRARLHIPAGTEEIEVVFHPSLDPAECEAVICEGPGRSPTRLLGDQAQVRFRPNGAEIVDLRLVSKSALDLDAVADPRRTIWPAVRRLLTYTRDQTMPLARRRPQRVATETDKDLRVRDRSS